MAIRTRVAITPEPNQSFVEVKSLPEHDSRFLNRKIAHGNNIIGKVAANFINGPMGANGSKNIKPMVPATLQIIPERIPKIKKQTIQTMLIGSKRAIPHGNLGIKAAENETTIDKAPNNAAPAISRVGE